MLEKNSFVQHVVEPRQKSKVFTAVMNSQTESRSSYYLNTRVKGIKFLLNDLHIAAFCSSRENWQKKSDWSSKKVKLWLLSHLPHSKPIMAWSVCGLLASETVRNCQTLSVIWGGGGSKALPPCNMLFWWSTLAALKHEGSVWWDHIFWTRWDDPSFVLFFNLFFGPESGL